MEAGVTLGVTAGGTSVAMAVAAAGPTGLAPGTAVGVEAARPQAASSAENMITAASLFITALLYHNGRVDAKLEIVYISEDLLLVILVWSQPMG